MSESTSLGMNAQRSGVDAEQLPAELQSGLEREGADELTCKLHCIFKQLCPEACVTMPRPGQPAQLPMPAQSHATLSLLLIATSLHSLQVPSACPNPDH